MIPGKQYTSDELLQALWRRTWLIVVSFVLVSTVTVVVSSRMPDRYRAEALIVAAPQSVSQDFVRATITPLTQIRDRMPTINQQILSRASLEPIIRDLNLYAAMRQTSPMEAVINRDIESASRLMSDHIQAITDIVLEQYVE